MKERDWHELLAKHEAVVKAFDGFIYVCSQDYEIEFMNDDLIRRTGYDAVGQKCYKALHDMENVCSWCVNDRVYKGETVRWEMKSPKDNRWYRIVNSPVHHDDGRVSKVALISDITEQRETEEALRRGERFLSNVFASIQDGISVLDTDLTIIRVNPITETKSSFMKPVVGRKCYEAYHGRDVPCEACPSMVTLRTGKSANEILSRTGPGGETLGWIDLFSFPFFDTETGELKGVIEYVRDITERRKAAEKIESLNKNLEEHARELEIANKELESFSYSVSHDLRSPLVGIEGLCGMLLKKYSDVLGVRGKEYVQRIGTTTRHMQNIIADLLKLSRAMRKSICHEIVDLSRIARETAETLEKTQPGRSIDCSVAEGVTVRGDAGLLTIVMENLMENAWKFTRRNPLAKIEFGVLEKNGRPACFVRDNGVGFDMARAEKLFEAFVRLHQEEEFEGTGIGLTTVQRIIRRHGGEIWAESEAGRGATFYFTLPEGDGSS